jgi:uncharacterized protein
MSRRRTLLLSLATGLIVLACMPSDDEDVVNGAVVMSFDTTRVLVATARDTVSILAEVARTQEQRTMGLMERRVLAEGAGMLFLYDADQPASAGFWMFRTRIPLDIAFTDSAGRIVAIRQMAPCEAQLAAGCPSYEPGAPYRAALEVNGGLLARRGVTTGSRLMTRELPASLAGRAGR